MKITGMQINHVEVPFLKPFLSKPKAFFVDFPQQNVNYSLLDNLTKRWYIFLTGLCYNA